MILISPHSFYPARRVYERNGSLLASSPPAHSVSNLQTMATVAHAAQQVVLHPTVSQSLKVLGTTLGRDKVRIPIPPLLTSLSHYAPDIPRRPILCTFPRMAAPLQRLQDRGSEMERAEEPPCAGQEAYVLYGIALSSLQRGRGESHVFV